jgi:hypothetical protein
MHLGMGDNLWARIVDETLTNNKLENFLTVTGKAKKNLSPTQNYFLCSWDRDASTQLASNNGPCRTISNVQSNDCPKPIQMIKKFFLSNPCSKLPPSNGSTKHFHVSAWSLVSLLSHTCFYKFSGTNKLTSWVGYWAPTRPHPCLSTFHCQASTPWHQHLWHTIGSRCVL